jgi:prepilin-type N-terminal cleavage/methylation domain-containing protein
MIQFQIHQRQYRVNFGFSLIELMIVIAIIGILATFGIQSYSTYITKAKIANALPYLEKLKTQVITAQELNGGYPEQLATELGMLNKGGSLVISNSLPVKAVTYNIVPGKGFYTCISMAGLGITDMVDAESGNDGKYNRICLLANYTAGHWTSYCGNLNTSDTQNLPIEYLPSGCNCKDILTPQC